MQTPGSALKVWNLKPASGTWQWDRHLEVGRSSGTRQCDLAVCVVANLCGLNIQYISNFVLPQLSSPGSK